MYSYTSVHCTCTRIYVPVHTSVYSHTHNHQSNLSIFNHINRGARTTSIIELRPRYKWETRPASRHEGRSLTNRAERGGQFLFSYPCFLLLFSAFYSIKFVYNIGFSLLYSYMYMYMVFVLLLVHVLYL